MSIAGDHTRVRQQNGQTLSESLLQPSSRPAPEASGFPAGFTACSTNKPCPAQINDADQGRSLDPLLLFSAPPGASEPEQATILSQASLTLLLPEPAATIRPEDEAGLALLSLLSGGS